MLRRALSDAGCARKIRINAGLQCAFFSWSSSSSQTTRTRPLNAVGVMNENPFVFLVIVLASLITLPVATHVIGKMKEIESPINEDKEDITVT